MEITSIIKEKFLLFDADDQLSSLIGKLQQSKQRTGLVFKNGRYKGVIEKKGLLRARLDAAKTKINSFTQKAPLVNEHADVIETAYLMFNSNLDCLPVESNKKVIGIIESLDLAALAVQLAELVGLKVKDVRLEELPRLNKNDPLSTALEIMYQKRVEQVPIFEDDGRLFGLISQRDILKKYFLFPPKGEVSSKFNKEEGGSRSAEVDRINLSNLPVSSFSTNDNLLTVSGQESLLQSLSLMGKNNVSSALVLTGDDFQGLLTVKNILRLVGSFQIPQHFNLQFIDLNLLDIDPYEKKSIKKIASNEAFKLQRMIKNNFQLLIHVKAYSKTGRQHKYSVHLKLEFPGQIVAVDQDDWDIRRAFHKAFRNAHNKIKKMFHGDASLERHRH